MKQDAGMVLKVCKTYHGNLTLLPAAKKTTFLRVCQTSASRSIVDHMSLCCWWRSVIHIYIFCQKDAGMIFLLNRTRGEGKFVGPGELPPPQTTRSGS